MALPDSARVIGEGRFPGEIPLDFENLITKGVRITNSADKNEFNEVSNLIDERSQFIKDKKLDRTLIGERILNNRLNELGFNEFSNLISNQIFLSIPTSSKMQKKKIHY
ncbi:MAG: hypothetical protein IPG24_27900 [Leptospiraceae bacterium]|nr:hypothetical protein [Leptospiraceae bacterium]